MKVLLDKKDLDYVEAKLDNGGQLDLSIRTTQSDKKSLIITAKLNKENLDKLIANLILLKSKMQNE